MFAHMYPIEKKKIYFLISMFWFSTELQNVTISYDKFKYNIFQMLAILEMVF